MTHTQLPPPPPRQGRRFSFSQVLALIFIAIVLTAFATVFIIRYYLFPPPFQPVTLTASEQHRLEQKLDTLQTGSPAKAYHPLPSTSDTTALQPEQYNEDNLSREILFTERELNALIAHNTDLATKLAIDLSEGLVSLKLLIPMDPDFPMLGGKTLRVKTGAELAYSQGKPVVRLKGVSIMGVPLPNSWLGGLKNIDLVREFGETEGFWKSFADGIDSIRITDGSLAVRLKP